MAGGVDGVSNQKDNTVLIGGVRFLKDEVIGVNKKTTGIDDEGKPLVDVFTVQTTFGRFEYASLKAKQGYWHGKNNPSIMNGELKDVGLNYYKGTKNQDILHVTNSCLGEVDLSGDEGNNDIIYMDETSMVDSNVKKDNCDQVWQRVI